MGPLEAVPLGALFNRDVHGCSEMGAGLQRHRAVLFKYAFDSLGFPSCCALVGCDSCGSLSGQRGARSPAVSAAELDQVRIIVSIMGRPMLVDLMDEPGEMRAPQTEDLHKLITANGYVDPERPP